MVGRFYSTSQDRENQISRYLTVQSRIEILIGFEFRGILQYKFKLRFLFNLNLQLTKICPPFRISKEFRKLFDSAFRVSSSTERAVMGTDFRATWGLVSNLPHPCVNKTKQHRVSQWDMGVRCNSLFKPASWFDHDFSECQRFAIKNTIFLCKKNSGQFNRRPGVRKKRYTEFITPKLLPEIAVSTNFLQIPRAQEQG